ARGSLKCESEIFRKAGQNTPPSSRRTPGPIPSVVVMRKMRATCGNNSPNHNHRWLWVPAFAGTTNRGVRRSILVRRDLQQREGTEHARRGGRRGRVQKTLVQLGKAVGAEQAEAALHLVLQKLQHAYDAGLAAGGERPALQAAEADQIGAGRDRLHDVGAAAERAVDHDIRAPADGGND